MLKKLCKQCKHNPVSPQEYDWWFEANWKNGYIACCSSIVLNNSKYRSYNSYHINAKPPDYCPYILEHMLHAE